MSSVDEQLTMQFYLWELRGRGWQLFDEPVIPEPAFRPFLGHYLPVAAQIDDGRRPTKLSSLVEALRFDRATEPSNAADELSADDEPLPEFFERTEIVELAVRVPSQANPSRDAFEQFLFNLTACDESIAFELLGTHDAITLQFVACPSDANMIRRQFEAHFPDLVLTPNKDTLGQVWKESAKTAIIELGLANEFMLPLAIGRLDALIGLAGALAELQSNEVGLFQVLFQSARAPWGESMLRAVTDNEGASFFANRPELLKAAKNKLARPLFAAVIRLAAQSFLADRPMAIVNEMMISLTGGTSTSGNALIPLPSGNYPPPHHQRDVLSRQSRRPGMLLNTDELLEFVHLPSAAVQTSKLVRKIKRTKPAPMITVGNGLLLGRNMHLGKETDVRLSPEQRVRHIHVIGVPGTGKSTLLFNLIWQDIRNGDGLAVLDPHGDLIERILQVIPHNRIRDVIILDAADEQFSIGFNILSAHSDLEKTLLASDLVSVFQRLSTSWGDQMSSVLRNAILAFLESDRGGTLADLRRFLLDKGFREDFLKTVRDPEVVYYWQKGFNQLTGNKSIGPVMTRLDTFLSPKPIRYMVSQRVNRLDFADIMDSGKILLAKLPQGQIGQENAYLLGSLLVAKFQQAAMSRQRLAESHRRPFWLYLDEFHHFITPSMAEILSGARKYHLGLVLAHQELRQLQRDPDVASAVLSAPYARIVFRVGDADARTIAEGFVSFQTEDIQKLGNFEAICRVERSDFDFNLTVEPPEKPVPNEATATSEEVIAASRTEFATPRANIEAMLRETLDVRMPTREEKFPKAAPALSELKPEANENAQTGQAPLTTQPPSQSKPREVAPLPDMGRGGVQHQAIQQRLKAVAETLGFRVTLEKPVLDGQGAVDLVLEKPERVIACEINVTSTIDQETGNVSKCLKAGFSEVAVICPKADRLSRLAEAMRGCFAPAQVAKTKFYSPDEFIAHLQNATLEDSKILTNTEGSDERRRGYKIRRHFVELSPEESKAREDSALQMLAEKMRRTSSASE